MPTSPHGPAVRHRPAHRRPGAVGPGAGRTARLARPRQRPVGRTAERRRLTDVARTRLSRRRLGRTSAHGGVGTTPSAVPHSAATCPLGCLPAGRRDRRWQEPAGRRNPPDPRTSRSPGPVGRQDPSAARCDHAVPGGRPPSQRPNRVFATCRRPPQDSLALDVTFSELVRR